MSRPDRVQLRKSHPLLQHRRQQDVIGLRRQLNQRILYLPPSANLLPGGTHVANSTEHLRHAILL